MLPARRADRSRLPWKSKMTFRYTCTLPISGANKLPRFRQWAMQNASDIAVSLPPQVPAKTETLTIRLKSLADRQTLLGRFEGVEV
jgi:hypothetical protein